MVMMLNADISRRGRGTKENGGGPRRRTRAQWDLNPSSGSGCWQWERVRVRWKQRELDHGSEIQDHHPRRRSIMGGPLRYRWGQHRPSPLSHLRGAKINQGSPIKTQPIQTEPRYGSAAGIRLRYDALCAIRVGIVIPISSLRCVALRIARAIATTAVSDCDESRRRYPTPLEVCSGHSSRSGLAKVLLGTVLTIRARYGPRELAPASHKLHLHRRTGRTTNFTLGPAAASALYLARRVRLSCSALLCSARLLRQRGRSATEGQSISAAPTGHEIGIRRRRH